MAAGSGRVWKLILGYSRFQAKSEQPFLLGRRDPIQQVFNSLSTCLSRSVVSPLTVELNAYLRHHYGTTNVTNKGKRANRKKVGQSSVQASESTIKQESVANDKVQSADAKQGAKRRVRANHTKVGQSSLPTSKSTVRQELAASGKIQSVESQSSVQASESTVKKNSVANDKVQSANAKQGAKRRVRANHKKTGQSSVPTSRSTVRQELVANGKIHSIESHSSVQAFENTVKQESVANDKVQSANGKQGAKRRVRENHKKVGQSSVPTSRSTVWQNLAANGKIQSVESQSSVQASESTVKQESVANDKVQSADAKQGAKRRVRPNHKKVGQSSLLTSKSTIRQELAANGKIQSVESQSSVQNSSSTVRQELAANGKIQTVESQSAVQTSSSTVRQELAANGKIQSVESQSPVQTSSSAVRQELVANGKIQSVESQSAVQNSSSTVRQELAANGKIQSVESQSPVQTSSSAVGQELVANGKIQSVDSKQETKRRVQVLKGNLTYREYISKLRDALINAAGSTEEVRRILNQEASTLDTPGIEIFLWLLNCLESNPQLAIEVFNWKRTRSDVTITLQEYSKSIIIAGRAKDIDLAVELFAEIESRGIKKETSMYNSLMTAYVCNGLTKKTLSLFEDLKRDPDCSPTIVTYNILLSTFGRSMLVDHMEMVNQAIEESGLSPSIHTYNTVIAGYVTAWMWDEMETYFKKMERSSVKPNCSTYSLLVRGYAFSGQVKKMEEAFDHLKKQLNQKDVPIIRAMIHAYSKSNDADKATKIERLLKYIPKEDYRPWLDVVLIAVYAKADAVEKMETSIIGALDRCTMISTTSVTRLVTTTYFRHGAIDKLESFVMQAKTAGWKLCRSVYHGRMLMYGLQSRLNDMENVMEEMKSSRFRPIKKTFLILYKIYTKFGNEGQVKWTLKRMKTAGFDLPEDSQILWEECFAGWLQ